MLLKVVILLASEVLAVEHLVTSIRHGDFSTFPPKGVKCGPKGASFDVTKDDLVTAVNPSHAEEGLHSGHVSVKNHVVLVKYNVKEDTRHSSVKYEYQGTYEQVGTAASRPQSLYESPLY